MRGALMIVVVITLLIIGVLVMKNMGTDPSESMTPSQARQTIDRAQDAAEDAAEKMGLTQQQLDRSE
jgi:hypothetical protein